MRRVVKIKNISVGEEYPLLFILGPCVIEDFNSLREDARRLKEISQRENINFIFKASYDKANRTSLDSYRGPGLKEGIKMLAEIKKELSILVTSDVHTPQEVGYVAGVLDLIQIPAFLCRQTDLIVEAARTQKAVNIKKGQFMAPWDMIKIVNKAYAQGNRNILVTERGTCFGYNYLVNDIRAIPRMQEDGLVVIFDATHSVQLPSKGKESGGEKKYVPYLVKAAVAVGVDGLFLEVHSHPQRALSDSATMIALEEISGIIQLAKRIKEAVTCTGERR